MNRRAFAITAAATVLSAPALARATPLPPLTGRQRDAQQAPARFLMVMLHGAEGNGGDILSRTKALQRFIPTVAEAAPNGPLNMSFLDHNWVPLSEIEKRQTTLAEVEAALNSYCDAELARLDLGPDKLILLGFSQGSVMALNVGLRRSSAPAAIIGFSGPYVTDEPLAPGKPAVLLVHGADDASINPRAEQDVVERLTAAGIPVESHTLDGLGHAIDQRGIDLAGALLARVTA